MNKYKVKFLQTEVFIVDVYAKNEKEARKKAEDKRCEGGYQETGETIVEVGDSYDVTHIDDPFNP